MIAYSLLLVASLATGFGSAAQAQPTPQLSGSFVVMHAGPLARQGSFRACIMANVGRGLSLKVALALCNFDDHGWDRGDPLDTAGWPLGSGTRPSGTGSVICASASIDPTQVGGSKDAAWAAWFQATVDRDAAEKAAQKASEAVIAAGNDVTGEQLKEAAALAIKAVEAQKRVDKALDEYNKQVASENKFSDPRVESACAQVAEFVAKCKASRWRTPECKRALDRATSCGDPMITDPIPGMAAQAAERDSEARRCNLPAANPETVKKAWVVHCESRVRPLPGVDPCGPLHVEGTLHHFFLQPLGRGENKACGDPRALTEAGDCIPSITLLEFGERDMEAIIAELQKKAGGPVITVPQPRPPGDPRPGPDPGPK
jgi:hypothetical protein